MKRMTRSILLTLSLLTVFSVSTAFADPTNGTVITSDSPIVFDGPVSFIGDVSITAPEIIITGAGSIHATGNIEFNVPFNGPGSDNYGIGPVVNLIADGQITPFMTAPITLEPSADIAVTAPVEAIQQATATGQLSSQELAAQTTALLPIIPAGQDLITVDPGIYSAGSSFEATSSFMTATGAIELS